MMYQPLTPDELERLIFHMPVVAQDAGDTWAAGFARSIIRQSRKRNWRPSIKQLTTMRKLVADLFAGANQGGEIDVVE